MNAADLDPVLHSASRIGIMIRLVIDRSLRFSELRDETGLTAGNLATHLRVLAHAGYVEQDLERTAERIRTVRVTAAGEEAFRTYATTMRALVDQMESSSKPSSPP